MSEQVVVVAAPAETGIQPFTKSIIKLREEAPASREVIEKFAEQFLVMLGKLERVTAKRLAEEKNTQEIRAYGLTIGIHLGESLEPEFLVIFKTEVELDDADRMAYAKVAYGKRRFRQVLPLKNHFRISVGVAGTHSEIGSIESFEYIRFGDAIALLVAGFFNLNPKERLLNTADAYGLKDAVNIIQSPAWAKKEGFSFVYQRSLF